MKLTELVLDELERKGTVAAGPEVVPAGKADWKPHDRSMIFGYLADMIANIPSWVAMIVTARARYRPQSEGLSRSGSR
jgi:hypothetical protein